jgi:hypothetical protein
MTEHEDRLEDHPDYEPQPGLYDEEEDLEDETTPPEPAEGDEE